MTLVTSKLPSDLIFLRVVGAHGVAFHFRPSHPLAPKRPFVMFSVCYDLPPRHIEREHHGASAQEEKSSSRAHLHGHVFPTQTSSCELEDGQAVLHLELSFRADCVGSM